MGCYGPSRPMGHILNGDGNEIADTLQCCHCGGHFQVVPGSGNKRGFCTRCHGVTCGREMCDQCVPAEQQLENMEAGRPVFWTPTRCSVG